MKAIILGAMLALIAGIAIAETDQQCFADCMNAGNREYGYCERVCSY